MQWCVPVFPATWEAEVGGLSKSRSLRSGLETVKLVLKKLTIGARDAVQR